MATETDSSTDTEGTGAGEIEARVGLRYTLRQVKRDTTALIGIYTVGFITVVALLASIDHFVFDYAIAETVWYSPVQDPDQVERLLPPVGMENQYGPGVLEHPMGTDHRGRDILGRLFYGTRIAITVGFMATAIGLVGGTLIGAVSGYYGGWIDDVLQRVTETLYAIPYSKMKWSIEASNATTVMKPTV